MYYKGKKISLVWVMSLVFICFISCSKEDEVGEIDTSIQKDMKVVTLENAKLLANGFIQQGSHCKGP